MHVDTNHEQQIARLSSRSGDWLRIQPGRDLVRFGLDFYANRYRAAADEALQERQAQERPEKVLDGALATLERHKVEVPRRG